MKRHQLITIGFAALALLVIGCARQGDKSSGVVTVNGVELPYFIEGEGIPCIVTCDALPQSRALSRELRKYFKFIFIEPRVGMKHDKEVDYSHITMNTLIEDIEHVRQELDLAKVAVMGHSACGLFALEYARKYPQHTSHVIMIGTPPGWSMREKEAYSEYWKSNASDDRKMILNRNWESLSEDRLNSLPPSEAAILRYIANTPRYWCDPTYDPSGLLEGYYWNVPGWNHFFGVVMADYDVGQGDQITTPIFLALGMYDYVVPYYLWVEEKGKLLNLFIHIFEKSGHYPMLEEQALFDSLLIDWIKGQ